MFPWFRNQVRQASYTQPRRKDEVAVIAIRAVLQFHPRNARQACAMFTGTKMTDDDWRKCEARWERGGKP